MSSAEPIPAPAGPTEPDPATGPVEHRARILRTGTLDLTGRLTDASNVTLVGTVTLDGQTLTCVYKPVRGERPLWDFPDGTLAERERAAALVAELAGWDCVPLTVLRDGPLGPGMVQEWIDTPAAHGDGGELVDLFVLDELPPGWLPVLRAVDQEDREVVLAHADDPALAVLAAFDVVTNNADRKGSHVLAPADGRVLGVDHGLCLHAEDKLRTVLWGWAGRPLPEPVLHGLRRLAATLPPTEPAGGVGEDAGPDARPGSPVTTTADRPDAQDPGAPEDLESLLTVTEVRALSDRVRTLLRTGTYPLPPQHRTPIPWPAL